MVLVMSTSNTATAGADISRLMNIESQVGILREGHEALRDNLAEVSEQVSNLQNKPVQEEQPSLLPLIERVENDLNILKELHDHNFVNFDNKLFYINEDLRNTYNSVTSDLVKIEQFYGTKTARLESEISSLTENITSLKCDNTNLNNAIEDVNTTLNTAVSKQDAAINALSVELNETKQKNKLYTVVIVASLAIQIIIGAIQLIY